jgi:hypothetical protein
MKYQIWLEEDKHAVLYRINERQSGSDQGEYSSVLGRVEAGGGGVSALLVSLKKGGLIQSPED